MQNFVLPLGQRPKGRRVNKPTATALLDQAASVQRRNVQIFTQAGPSGPRQEKTDGLVLGAAGCKCPIYRSASTVIGGLGGMVTMSARSARRSSEPSPNASLVPFCAIRKELAHQGETMTQERR